MTRLQALHDAGVSIWLDTLSRELLDSGAFETLIADYAVTGATSNPTIFAKAITSSDRYDDQLRAAVATGARDPQELFFELALDDVGRAAELLRPTYGANDGRDGFVSFECTPDLADATAATIEQALELWNRLARPNVMIKVPATAAGIPAIEELTARGVNVNITLLFSLARYEQVIDAYIAGLERRLAADQPIDAITSVASFFVSRVDAKVDPLLAPDSDLRGRVAIANAHRAYRRYRQRFTDDRWRPLDRAGARPQRPLWASTGTKDPAYSDVHYIENLIAPDVINTMPEPTLRAFADHGNASRTLSVDAHAAERPFAAPRRRASTSTLSPPTWSAKASAPSVIPTTTCSHHPGQAPSRPRSCQELTVSVQRSCAASPSCSHARRGLATTGPGRSRDAASRENNSGHPEPRSRSGAPALPTDHPRRQEVRSKLTACTSMSPWLVRHRRPMINAIPRPR